MHFLEEMPPERLGLSGSDMSSYLLFPEEGICDGGRDALLLHQRLRKRDHRSWIPTWYQRMGADCIGLTPGRMPVSALT